MTYDRYSGDPKLYLTLAGWEIDYRGGQPVMETGLENFIIMSLFTRPGWCGNALLPPASQIGSDFLDACNQPVTLSALTDIADAAERALKSPYFPSISVDVQNPQSDRLSITITVASGVITLDRRGMAWIAQAGRTA